MDQGKITKTGDGMDWKRHGKRKTRRPTKRWIDQIIYIERKKRKTFEQMKEEEKELEKMDTR